MPELTHAEILLAEDDRELRTLFALMLRSDGYHVHEVCDGRRLLRELGTQVCRTGCADVDLVVSDLRMPGYNGLQVLAGLRRADWCTPFILITAFGSPEVHAEAHRLGAAAVLDKPFELEALDHAVRSVIPPTF